MRVDFVGGARRKRDGFENLGPRRPRSRNLSIKEPSNRRIFAAQSPYHSITDGILPVRSNMEAAHWAERERRMVRKALGVCLGSILVVCVGIGCANALLPATSTAAPVANAASNAKTTAMNSAIDASGVKDAVSDALLAHTWDIANATGISSAQVQTCIENLDIKDWQVADLPANAVPASTVSGSAAGVPATLTTYNNPGYVTISAYGQSIDLAVPAAAQQARAPSSRSRRSLTPNSQTQLCVSGLPVTCPVRCRRPSLTSPNIQKAACEPLASRLPFRL